MAMKGVRQWLAGALLLLAAVPASGRTAWAEATIYFYRDGAGVLHFTNRPHPSSMGRWSVFAVFRNHPGLDRAEVDRLARKYSQAYNIDWRLVLAVIEVESRGDPTAVSPKGAEGLMQIMPSTQRSLGVERPFDPEENVAAGVRYLREMMDRFGSVELALAAYNAGPGQVERYGGVPPFRETENYIDRVLEQLDRMVGE